MAIRRGLVLAALLLSGSGCGALQLPTPAPQVHTVSVVVDVPAGLDKAQIDAAQAVFVKRLNAIGITNFTVAVGPAMNFTLVVPETVDSNAVQAVLHQPGVVAWLSWPAGSPAAAPGDSAPAGATPLFDAAKQIAFAGPTTDASGQAAVDIRFRPEATKIFADYTAAHVSEPLPIVMDGVVLAAPTIQAPIPDGDVIVTGPTVDGLPLVAFAAILDSGPLPEAWRR